MKIYKKYKNILLSILFIVSVIYIILYITPTATGFDENYTLALIHNSYHNIIYFDSIDVHPFLYYFLLKSFINITTFWTHLLFIKIISARIFSIILLVITFFILRKILSYFHIINNICIEWILFIILPGILNQELLSNTQLINIRMYALASLFISIEFLYLLKFSIMNTNKYLVIATICAILASYTHYYALIFGGLLLLIYLIRNLFKNNKVNSIKLLICGFTLLISFIPWIPIFIKQISNNNTYWMTNPVQIKEIIKFLLFIILFFYPLYKYDKDNKNNLFHTQILNIYLVLTFTFTLILIFIFFKGNIFQSRYMFPISIIYEFISINIILKILMKKSNKKRSKIICISILLLLMLMNLKTFIIWDIPVEYNSIRVTYNCNRNNTKLPNIYINKNESTDSILLSNMFLNHKVIIVPKNSKKYFKTSTNIYYNPEYKILFKNEIDRIKFES